MTGEFKATSYAIHCKDGDVVAPLIATKEELSTGIKVEAPRIIAACPFFSDERKFAARADGKDTDAVVQSIARV